MNKLSGFLLLSAALVFLSHTSYCQAHTTNNIAVKELKAGDKMADISLGTTSNNPTPYTKFSQFRGKLVILDFWATFCGSCMESLPHLQALQDRFGEKIQIILVDPYETSAQIETALKKAKYTLKFYQYVHSKNIISIVGAKKLDSIFPHHDLGYDVWIDKNGVVRLLGNGINNNVKKISAILSDKPISYIVDDGEYTKKDKALFLTIPDRMRSSTQISIVSGYFPDYGTGGGVVIDSLNPSDPLNRRTTIVNYNVLELFDLSVSDFLESAWKNKVYSTNVMRTADHFSLLVKDTLDYSFYYHPSGQLGEDVETDKAYIKSAWCYEQIVPRTLPDSIRNEYMFQDLKRFFENLYHVRISLENVKIPCYSIVRRADSMVDLSKRVDTLKPSVEEYMDNEGYTWLHIWNGKISNLDGLFRDKMFKGYGLVIDGTGYGTTAIAIDLPEPHLEEKSLLNSLEDVRNLLRRNGLDLVATEVELPRVVIKEVL